MSTTLIDLVELRARGFAALVDALGWVNAVRFIQQYEPSRQNYTAQRDQVLPDSDAAEMLRRMKTMTSGEWPGCTWRIAVTPPTTSCGFGVPLLDFRSPRDTLADWSAKQTAEQLAAYRAKTNQMSIDGLVAFG